ncbi:hypothetical protein BTVI_153489 [Pitangus sulphuratus]|nr:hypothetical protein BTVI_153489 [Pitangus sulphuratus]
MPQFFMGRYRYERFPSTVNSTVNISPCLQDKSQTPLTSLEKSQAKINAGCEKEAGSSMWIYVLLGNLLRGIGETPIQPLGITYIDDYAIEENAALYIGCVQTVAIIGPIFGFLLGSLCAKLYVDIGFVDLDFFPSLKSLFGNPVYILYLCASIIQFNSLIGMVTYKPKYIEQQYGQTSSKTNFVIGLINIPAVAFGIFSGGLVMKKFRIGVLGAAKLSLGSSFFGYLLLLSLFAMGCENSEVAGLTVSYHGTKLMTAYEQAVFSECNAGCSCSNNDWDPICGENGVTYISACLAGCQASNGSGKNTVRQSFIPMCDVIFFANTTRCIKPHLKSFALGIYTLAIRVLGSDHSVNKSTMTVETKSSNVNGSNQEAEPNQPLDDEENKTQPLKKKTSSCSGLKAFLAALSFSYFSKALSGTIMKSSITQIERRFELTSSTAGFVDGSFEMGNLLVIAFVSYFGAKLHRPKVIAVGCFTMALGCFLSAMPHFFMGYYKYETASHRASSANLTSSINPCSLHQDMNDTTLEVSHSACLHTIAMMGPMFGFLLGSLCAKLYVDVGFVDPGITSLPPVGIGIFLGGFIMKKYKMGIVVATKFSFIMSFLAYAISFLHFFVGCESYAVAGMTVSYEGKPIPFDENAIFSDCNSHCKCASNVWDPVCGDNGITCVQPEFKALAVGLYTLIMRMLAGIPAPVYFGAVIDKTCLKWGSTSCGQRGACRLYDSVSNRYVFLGLAALLRGPSYLFAIICYIFIKKHFQNKNSEPIENGQEDAPMNKEDNCKIQQRLPGSPDGENESSI